jgi:hypothetical protein
MERGGKRGELLFVEARHVTSHKLSEVNGSAFGRKRKSAEVKTKI